MDTKITSMVVAALVLGGLGGYAFANNSGQEIVAMDIDDMPMDEMGHDLEGSSMSDMMTVMNDDLGTKTGEEFEIAFLEGMIDHHVGAVDMAELVLKNTERPELVQMANDIIEVQNAEINMMQKWRDSWYQ